MKLVNNTKDKTILFIVHNYNSFQKDPIEETAKYFKKVYVLVRYKPISKIAKYLPFKRLKKYQEDYVIDRRKIPNNVEVIRTPVWYLPFGFLNRLLGEAHFKAVDQAIKKHQIKFDIVHCHFLWSSGYVGMKLKEKYKVPFVVTGHGYDVYNLPFKSEYWREKLRKILCNADKVLTVSDKNKEYLKKLGIDSGSITVVGNGYNPKLFYQTDQRKERVRLDISQNKKILLAIGNLESVKGHKYLVEAVKEIKRLDPDILCYIIGEGSWRSRLAKKVKDLNLQENVILLGYLPHNKINGWLNACDIFVLPSLKESFGIVQLEAFACGKPVVATKTEGSKEIIISEEYGLLCNVSDSKDLAETIRKALNREWNTEKIKEYGEGFTWENISKKILKVYDNLDI